MSKKALSAIILIGILFISLACLGGATTEQAIPPTAQSPTVTPTEDAGIHLAADGSGDYPDLKTAIENAELRDTIRLAAGVYRLDTTLEIKDSITLIGDDYENTTIVSEAGGSVIHFTGNGLYTLEGITVQHEGIQLASAILVDKGVVNFSNCRLTGATIVSLEEGKLAAGLFAAGESTGSVKNCIVDNNSAAGFLLTENSNLSLENNICQHNDGFGVVIRDSASGLALNNKCNDNVVAGFFLVSSGEITLKNNECSNNGAKEDSSGGIIVRGPTKPTLEGNTCTDNPSYGIVYREDAGGKAINNNFSHNGREGIHIEGNAAPELEGNTCNQNSLAGIYIQDEAAPYLKNNSCLQNGTAENGAGIVYFDKTEGVAIGNTVSGNRDGFFLGGEAAPQLLENNCSENIEYGIFYSSTTEGMAMKNQCTGNGKAGIFAAEYSTPLLQENICSGNLVGIAIVETANPELVNNDLYENTQDDLVDLRP